MRIIAGMSVVLDVGGLLKGHKCQLQGPATANKQNKESTIFLRPQHWESARLGRALPGADALVRRRESARLSEAWKEFGGDQARLGGVMGGSTCKLRD